MEKDQAIVDKYSFLDINKQIEQLNPTFDCNKHTYKIFFQKEREVNEFQRTSK